MKLWPWRKAAGLDRDSDAAFLEFARSALRSSYSQRFQDLFGLWENGFATSGYFVEFGAMGGRDYSNSYVLEQLGWDGVVAEPHPGHTKRVKKVRRCYVSTKCVFDRTGDTVTFHAVRGRPALSTVEGFGTDDARSHFREDYVAHAVETITLGDLLDEAGAPTVIDYLSIDTEGTEIPILKAYDFGSRPIRAISVEHNDSHRDELYELLTARGFRRKWPEFSGHDDWYVHTDMELPDRKVAARDQLVSRMAEIEPFERQYEHRLQLLTSLRGGVAS